MLTVELEGHEIVGIIVSVIVMRNEQLAVFPAASVICQALVVTPEGKLLPPGNPVICVVVLPGQLSLDETEYGITAVHRPESGPEEIFGGHEITGTILSATVTVNVQDPVNDAASAIIY